MDPHEQANSMIEILQKLFLWPKESDPNNLTNFFYFKYLLVCIFCGMPASLSIAHAYHYRFVANSTMTVDLSIILVLICLVIIFALFAYNLKQLVVRANLYNPRIGTFATIRVNYKIVFGFARYALVIVVVLLGLFARWDDERCERRKERNNNSLESCGLFLPIYLPFDYDFFPLKQSILMYQVVAVIIAFTALIQIGALLVFAIDCEVGLLNTLIRLAEDFDTALKHNHEVTGRLRTMVNIQQLLISYNRDIDKVSRYINMTLFIFGGLIMATTIFDVIKTGNIISVIHGSIWAICFILIEWAGQVPIDKGLEFERALYNSRWYKLEKSEDRRCFLLMLHVSQKPVAFYAGPSAEVSLPTLMALFKATYSGTMMLINAMAAK